MNTERGEMSEYHSQTEDEATISSILGTLFSERSDEEANTMLSEGPNKEAITRCCLKEQKRKQLQWCSERPDEEAITMVSERSNEEAITISSAEPDEARKELQCFLLNWMRKHLNHW